MKIRKNIIYFQSIQRTPADERLLTVLEKACQADDSINALMIALADNEELVKDCLLFSNVGQNSLGKRQRADDGSVDEAANKKVKNILCRLM